MPMKRMIASMIVFILLFSISPGAQDRSAEQTAPALRRARIKTWIGIGLIGSGALVLPLTASASSERSPQGATAATGVALIGSGLVLVWWGATDRRKVTQPHSTISASLGRTTSLQFRRSW